MPYGRIKIDSVTFTDGGGDRSIFLSGLVNLVSGSLSSTGAINIDSVRANTVSGTTVTGDAGSFATLTATTGNINTLVSSGLVSGTVARFNSITGNALTVNANINTSTITGFSCFFTTGQVLGTLTTNNISTNSVNAVEVIATSGTFTALSGGTVTGNTYNVTTINAVTGKYTSLSGTTVTGDYLNATSGHFNTITVDAPSTFNTDLTVNQKATIATGSFTTIERVNILSGGSAALPAINISGSSRTNGIYKGSNDSLSVVTSGIAHINISPKGYVGIGGNINPESYSISANNLVISGSSNEGLIINAGTNSFASILFTAPDKSYKGGIRYANINNSLDFVTNGFQRAVITSGGNFGIGTSFPNKNLEIQGTSSGVAADAVIRLRDQYSGAWFANTDNSAIEFYSADTNGPGAGVRSKIANTVQDTTGAAQALTFWTTQNTGGSALTERLRITSSGNVGIGTNSPVAGLDIKSNVSIRPSSLSTWNPPLSNGINVISNINTNNNSVPLISLHSDRSDRYATINCARSNSSEQIGIGFTTSLGADIRQRLLLDSVGRLILSPGTNSVNVGTSGTPLFTGFQINNNSTANGSSISVSRFNDDSASSHFYFVKSRNTDIQAGKIVEDGDELGTIYWHADNGTDLSSKCAIIQARINGSVTSTSLPTDLTFATRSSSGGGANERLRITSAGRVGIGSATPTALLDVSSDVLRLRTAKTPSSAGDTGNTGDICWDANYVYVCIATNTWKRSPLSTW